MAKAPAKPATPAPAKAAAPAASAPAAPDATAPAAKARKLRYQPRPDLGETFADGIERMTYDGRTLRIEFCVNRPDVAEGAGPNDLAKQPVVRLVLDLDGAVDLFNKINNLQSVLERQGVIRRQGA